MRQEVTTPGGLKPPEEPSELTYLLITVALISFLLGVGLAQALWGRVGGL